MVEGFYFKKKTVSSSFSLQHNCHLYSRGLVFEMKKTTVALGKNRKGDGIMEDISENYKATKGVETAEEVSTPRKQTLLGAVVLNSSESPKMLKMSDVIQTFTLQNLPHQSRTHGRSCLSTDRQQSKVR